VKTAVNADDSLCCVS